MAKPKPARKGRNAFVNEGVRTHWYMDKEANGIVEKTAKLWQCSPSHAARALIKAGAKELAR